MEISVLGSVEVIDDSGERLPLASRSQRAVLAGLVVRRGTSLTPEQLAEGVGLTVAGLRTTISRLRTRAGREIVETTPVGYRLGTAVVDADEFEELLEQARSLDAAERIEALESALALWRGDAFGDIADRGAILPDAVRLDDLRVSAAEDRIEALIETGRFAEAGSAAEAHVLVHPLRDRPRGLLMRSLAADGRQVEALRAFQQHRHRLAEEAGTEPGDALVELDARIAAGWHDQLAAPAVRIEGNLPTWPNAFVGREDEAASLVELIRDRRFVTLIGVGGVGKTRLAVEAVRSGHAEPDGCWLVELGPLGDGDLVPGAVASALGVRQAPGLSVTDSLVQWAGGRQLLLILDNCEHVLYSAAELAQDLVERCDAVRVLATSREPLMAAGEHVVPVPSLTLSDEAGKVGSAIELFVRRAEDELPSFDAESQLDTIVELCERLDGLPLAIELAAARVRSLSVADILDRIDERFRLLTGGRRTAVERHATLRATVEWSYQLLSDLERLAFDDLSIFEAAFTLDDAVRMLSRHVDDLEAVDLLSRLVDRSLVARRSAAPEYRMLETLRAFGREVHRRAGTIDEARAQHHAVMTDKAAETRRRCCGPAEHAVLSLAVAQLDDYRAAALWAVEVGRPDDAIPPLRDLTIPLMLWGEIDAIGSTVNGLLDAEYETNAATAACRWMASSWNLFLGGDVGRARPLADEAVELEPADPMAHIHVALAISVVGGDAQRAASAVDAAGALIADPAIEMWVHLMRGNMLLEAGRIDAARRAATEFTAWSTERDYPAGRAMALHLQGRIHAEADEAAAVDAFNAARTLAQDRIPAAWIIAMNLDRDLIPILHRLGRSEVLDVAVRCLESSLRRNTTGHAMLACAHLVPVFDDAGRHRAAALAAGGGRGNMTPADTRSIEEAPVRQHLGDSVYRELVAEGAAMPTMELLRILVAELRSVPDEPVRSAEAHTSGSASHSAQVRSRPT